MANRCTNCGDPVENILCEECGPSDPAVARLTSELAAAKGKLESDERIICTLNGECSKLIAERDAAVAERDEWKARAKGADLVRVNDLEGLILQRAALEKRLAESEAAGAAMREMSIAPAPASMLPHRFAGADRCKFCNAVGLPPIHNKRCPLASLNPGTNILAELEALRELEVWGRGHSCIDNRELGSLLLAINEARNANR